MKQTFSKLSRTCIVNCINKPINDLNYNQTNFRKLNFSSTVDFKNSTCWKCGAERRHSSLVFCEKCHVIQTPLQSKNYFKVFELEEKFSIDQQSLRNKFRNLQSLLHPDKFSNKSDEEQTISEEYSSLLNKAYNNLQTPMKRAEHLLNLRGENIGDGQTVEDPEFLMDIMSLNEEVENAGNDVEKLKLLNNKNKMALDEIAKEIDECFKSNDIQKAKLNIAKMKYFSSLNSRINANLRELGETD